MLNKWLRIRELLDTAESWQALYYGWEEGKLSLLIRVLRAIEKKNRGKKKERKETAGHQVKLQIYLPW